MTFQVSSNVFCCTFERSVHNLKAPRLDLDSEFNAYHPSVPLRSIEDILEMLIDTVHFLRRILASRLLQVHLARRPVRARRQDPEVPALRLKYHLIIVEY